MPLTWIDTHDHVDAAEFEIDRDAEIDALRAALDAHRDDPRLVAVGDRHRRSSMPHASKTT